MAKKEKVTQLRRRSHFAAMEGLRPSGGFPVPPRKAMSQARKASKGLIYPVPPYAGANLLQLFTWTRNEWRLLGKWQKLAVPVVLLVALTTWEKESGLQAERQKEIGRVLAKKQAAELYGAFGPPKRKHKLLGIIPLPG